jgi:lysophospholipase L1-like esterase
MTNYRYLALGDSYTIGEDVPFDLNFPSQLVKAVKSSSPFLCEKLQVIATTGWTTDELIKEAEEIKPEVPFDLVSLLIGVNNEYRGYPQIQYSKEFKILLEKAIEFAGGSPEKVFVISIPDYGCTPFGAAKSAEIHAGLLLYNEEAKRQATAAGVAFADIFQVSRLASSQPELTASDGLHPSPAMYAKWVEIMLPVVLKILSSSKSESSQSFG